MPDSDANELYNKGTDALKRGNTASALGFFSELIKLDRAPINCTLLGYCLAKEKADFRQGISLCKEGIKREPKGSEHFLYLGRIHLLAGQKKDAIRIFKMGLRVEKNQEIDRELAMLGTRKGPVLSFLDRGNPLNRFLGKVLTKLGIR